MVVGCPAQPFRQLHIITFWIVKYISKTSYGSRKPKIQGVMGRVYMYTGEVDPTDPLT